MSDDTGPDRAVPREDAGREGWIGRLKLALGLQPASSIRNDLEDALEAPSGGADAEFSREERRILRKLLAARGRRVQDVMVPRGNVIGISDTAKLEELRALFASAGHSRLPVYGETLDDPKGMVHIRDMFARLESLSPEVEIGSTGLVRPVLFAPATMGALNLLFDMQRQRIHMALVIDEYGATDGLVSLEDLLEIIVGEIEDEHDEDEGFNPVLREDGVLVVDGHAPLAEIARLTGVPFDAESDEIAVETIGGFATSVHGRLPIRGERVDGGNGLLFVVTEGDARRIKRLEIHRVQSGVAALPRIGRP